MKATAKNVTRAKSTNKRAAVVNDGIKRTACGLRLRLVVFAAGLQFTPHLAQV